jgi:FMN reductase
VNPKVTLKRFAMAAACAAVLHARPPGPRREHEACTGGVHMGENSRHDRDGRPLILGLSGSPRMPSSTDRALRIALGHARAQGADTELLSGSDLQFPIFGTADAVAPALQRFLDLYRRCDGLLLASPGYHGSISGLLKNALDYTDLLRETNGAYLDGKAVGCIVCAHGWQATGTTLVALRSIVHALRGWPTPLGVAINSSQPFADQDGNCLDGALGAQLSTVAGQVVGFAQMRIGHTKYHAKEPAYC